MTGTSRPAGAARLRAPQGRPRRRPRRHACAPPLAAPRIERLLPMDLKALIGQAATGAALTREQASTAFDLMMSGEATPSQMGGLLMALRVRGETVDEITGAVSAMRSK